jgi:hypothetical protein
LEFGPQLHLPSAICHLPSAICHLPSAICYLPFAICHLPFAICHLPFAICHLPLCLSPSLQPYHPFSRQTPPPKIRHAPAGTTGHLRCASGQNISQIPIDDFRKITPLPLIDNTDGSSSVTRVPRLLAMPMRTLITFMMFLTLVACGATRTQTDADISKALIGTWLDSPSDQQPLHGRVTYFEDGHSVEFVWPAGQPESTAVRIESRWSVTNSILTLTCVKSSSTQAPPIGAVIKDRVISISADKFVFEQADGYGDMEKKSHVRIRQPKTGG